MSRQGIGKRWKLCFRERDAIARDQFESRQAVTQRLPHRRKQAHGALDVGERDPGGSRALRLRKELEHCGGDDAERAFAAKKKLLQVVAGVVLAQAAQAVPNTPVGEHDFEPEHQIARVAVAKHRGAAGVGGKIPADRTTSFGSERQREEKPRIRGLGLHGCERHAGLDSHRRIFGVDRAHAVQPREHEHDLIAARIGRRASAQPRVAPLWHHRNGVLGADAHDRRNFRGRSRTHDRARASAVALSPVGHEGQDVGVRGKHVRATDGRLQRGEQGGASIGHRA